MNSGHSNKSGYIADLSLLGMTAIWGLTFTILKLILVSQFSSVFFVFARFSIAVIVLYPFCRGKIKDMDKSGIVGGIALGALIFAGFTSQSLGIEKTTASKAAFITGLSALIVPFFLFIHKKKFPSLLIIVAIFAALCGLYLLTDPVGGGFNSGDLLVLISAFIFGAQIYLMGIVAPGRNFLGITFIELATTAVLAGFFMFLEEIRCELSIDSILALLFMGVVATAVTLIIQVWGQQRTSSVKAGLIFTAEPVFAYIFAALILSEAFNSSQMAGALIIILAVVATELLPLLKKTKES